MTMKTKDIHILIVVCIFIITSCGYDNYDAPDSRFEGSVVYQGEPLNLDFRDVRFELWESGWKQKRRIDLQIDQNGSFSALLFKGDYKLYIPKNAVPFRAAEESDTILVEIRGDRKMDIEVNPYYLVKNASISNTGKTIHATFAIEQVLTGANQKDIERVTLYVSKTNLVSSRTDVGGAVSLNGGDIVDRSNIHLTREIPDMTPNQPYVYARIGVKLAGVEYSIFSPVQKLNY
jgi:hypothetical protein